MAEKTEQAAPPVEEGVATAVATRPAPARPRPKHLPLWKVLLHNDDVNDMLHVVASIVMITAIQKEEAIEKMIEAHETGVALLLTTHQERAELIQEQFASRGLTVTIEPAE
jgi:ATP-dependent Clp protease adaptor protein ClpS